MGVGDVEEGAKDVEEDAKDVEEGAKDVEEGAKEVNKYKPDLRELRLRWLFSLEPERDLSLAGDEDL